MTFSEWINFLVALFAITNLFGNIPIFIGLTTDKPHNEKRKIAVTTGIATLIVLSLTSWFGDYLLKMFAISLPAFQLAGALIITLLGLSMLQSKKSEISHSASEQAAAKHKDSIAVVPMTIPIIAGPGAFATIMVNAHQFPELINRMYSSFADLIVAVTITISLIFAGPMSRFIGQSGINIATRVMGMILVAIAMQMLADGLRSFFPVLGH